MGNHSKIDKPVKVDLGDYDASDTEDAEKSECESEMETLRQELSRLQEWLYAARQHSMLIVLQGMDTSGKDGTISHVMQSINPQGCAVASFKVPTDEESAHDFLWRVHRQAPQRGMITIFNRSHYEDVLVTRVHKLIDKDTCEQRYTHIRNFEELLADSKTLILKFFLHISKDEQEQRLLAREQDDEKAWKLSPGDWSERGYWSDYIDAYEDAIGATGTKYAPWYIVPANHKWYRNLYIARKIVETLRPHKDEWERELRKLGELRKEELAKMRGEENSGKRHGQDH
jgi:PPK2 family polyphosphate:nucleotide phosphotransferase